MNWAPDLEKFQERARGLYTWGISTGGWLSQPHVETASTNALVLTVSTGGWLSQPPVQMYFQFI